MFLRQSSGLGRQRIAKPVHTGLDKDGKPRELAKENVQWLDVTYGCHVEIL